MAAKLRALNPALLQSVWDGRQRIPRAYRLRLPTDGQHWSSDLLAQRLGSRELFAGQRAPPRYRVQRGETLAADCGALRRVGPGAGAAEWPAHQRARCVRAGY